MPTQDYSRRISQFVSVLADSAGLKAAIGLTHEAPATPETAAEIRRTIEAQLREMHTLVGYDLLAVTDWKGRTLASVEFGAGTSASARLADAGSQTPVMQSGIMQSGGIVYELTSTPIAIAGEQIGELKLGAKFDLTRYHLGGETALLAERPDPSGHHSAVRLGSAGKRAALGMPATTWGMRSAAQRRDLSGSAGAG